jgi:hypothetical protein
MSLDYTAIRNSIEDLPWHKILWLSKNANIPMYRSAAKEIVAEHDKNLLTEEKESAH